MGVTVSRECHWTENVARHFQTRIDQTFEGCHGVIGIADDIVVYGDSEASHDAIMHGMISRCEETGLKLNPDKCFIKQDQIKFYGIICTKVGIQPDPSKSVSTQTDGTTSEQARSPDLPGDGKLHESIYTQLEHPDCTTTRANHRQDTILLEYNVPTSPRQNQGIYKQRSNVNLLRFIKTDCPSSRCIASRTWRGLVAR